MRERPLDTVAGPFADLDRRVAALPIPARRRIDHADVDALAQAAIAGDSAAAVAARIEFTSMPERSRIPIN